jgi:radical SAM protein with 4Fe4S-binding SPASM domain
MVEIVPLLKQHLWSFPKAIEDIDKYRTSYGIKGISNSLLNGITYVLGRDPLAGPLYVGWEITFRCNAKCKFCNRWKTTTSEVTTSRASELIRELRGLGCSLLALTGGEPLLRSDIGVLSKLAKESGMAVNINTNGALLKAKAQELVDSDVDIITVSVDSDKAKIHDSARGVAGLFASLLEGIDEVRRIRKTRPKLKARINVGRHNYYLLDSCLKFWSRRVDEVILQPIHEGSRNYFEVPKEMRFSEKEKGAFTQNFNSLAEEYKWLEGEYYKNFSLFFFDPKGLQDKFRCFAGYYFLQIDPELNVYPCSAYIEKLGNLGKNSLAEIWDSKKAKNFRQMLRRKENRCTCWYNCNGIINCYLNKTIGLLVPCKQSARLFELGKALMN